MIYKISLNSFSSNVDFNIQYQGLFITCRNENHYYLNVDFVVLNQITWYYLTNCNPNSECPINVRGNIQVIFNGEMIYHPFQVEENNFSPLLKNFLLEYANGSSFYSNIIDI